jgi:eukaryotic-like serine/threonine-protein kinase
MAPEQFSGGADVRSDIWAAGAVLYGMATGRRCFCGARLPAVMEAILRRDPATPAPVNPGVSPGVDRVILQQFEPLSGGLGKHSLDGNI